jgi:hypothetical protein
VTGLAAEQTDTRVSRREYQKQLARRRRMTRKHRRARIRRVRLLRSIQTTRFWTRTLVVLAILFCVAFWSRYAYVYDIPVYVQRGELTGVSAYITKKPWWFGPPVFDLNSYQSVTTNPLVRDKYTILLHNLGRYQSVVKNPSFVWVQRH